MMHISFGLKICNAGNTPINPLDYEHPIKFDFGQRAQILSTAILKTSPESLKKEDISLTGIFRKHKFVPSLLNSGDTITFRALLSNYEGELKVSGRIVGIKQIKKSVKMQLTSWLLVQTVFRLSLLLLDVAINSLILSTHQPLTIGSFIIGTDYGQSIVICNAAIIVIIYIVDIIIVTTQILDVQKLFPDILADIQIAEPSTNDKRMPYMFSIIPHTFSTTQLVFRCCYLVLDVAINSLILSTHQPLTIGPFIIGTDYRQSIVICNAAMIIIICIFDFMIVTVRRLRTKAPHRY